MVLSVLFYSLVFTELKILCVFNRRASFFIGSFWVIRVLGCPNSTTFYVRVPRHLAIRLFLVEYTYYNGFFF